MSALGRGPVEKYGLRLVSNRAISGCPVVAGNGFLVTLYELLTVGFSHRLFYRIRKWCQGERYVCMGCMDVVANVAKFTVCVPFGRILPPGISSLHAGCSWPLANDAVPICPLRTCHHQAWAPSVEVLGKAPPIAVLRFDTYIHCKKKTQHL